MESKSGAKIAIRGKGSVKEGKSRSDGIHASNQEEDLHCLIMADTEEKVNKAKKLIHNVIETVCSFCSKLLFLSPPYYLCHQQLLIFQQAASIPEDQNKHKQNQLRDLATLNGTLRDDENQTCQNCKTCSKSLSRKCLTSLSFRWSNWTSQVRLPRATQLHSKYYLSCLRECRAHGTGLSRPKKRA